jgi:hypothetical protein
MLEQCPLYPQKRTSIDCIDKSALCQKQTLHKSRRAHCRHIETNSQRID